MTSLKSVKKRRQQLHARDVRGLVSFSFCPLENKKIVNKSCLPSIFKVQNVLTRPNKHAELLRIHLKPLVKNLKKSTFVAKSELRFKFH